jgi:type IV secretory pathway protease TraF
MCAGWARWGSRAHAIALVGVQGHTVEIEADIEYGMVALLLAGLDDLVRIGELGLDGSIRPVPGVLPAAAAAAAGFGAVGVAAENAADAVLVPELRVIAAPSLAAFTAWIRNRQPPDDPVVLVLEPGRDIGAAIDVVSDAGQTEITAIKDLADLVGQPVARRAAEICAAGGHHLMLLGPPGVGKTMLELKQRSGRMQAEVKDAYWKIFDTEDLSTSPGLRLLQVRRCSLLNHPVGCGQAPVATTDSQRHRLSPSCSGARNDALMSCQECLWVRRGGR